MKHSIPPNSKPKWFRGQLHTHTYWSDARGFPEQTAAIYKQNGYDFLCITDHNRFAEDPNTWRNVAEEEGPWPPQVTRAIFDTYLQTFGKDWVESKTDGSVTSVRLKTYAELKEKFEEPGKFMLLPGSELTYVFQELSVHLNYINLPLMIPSLKSEGLVKVVEGPSSITELIAMKAQEVEEAARGQNVPYLLMLNHPFWVYYDIAPRHLIDCPQIRFFEICNFGSDHAPHPDALTYTVDKFWDIVNAFRAIHGHPLLLGVGSDDAHFYDAQRIDGNGGVGDAWVMVRATDLTPEHLLAAMHQGDFYASSGVLLNEVTFSPTDKTLHVAVKAEPGVQYRIDFITTKRNFDQTVTELASPAEDKKPARTIPIYSDDIGRTVKSVTDTEASYQLEADDLYVRARVESDSPSKTTPHFHPKHQIAWTQPYF